MRILEKFLRKYNKKLFNTACQSVIDTAGVKLNDSSNLAIVSQTYEADLYMYLVAAKTFANYVHPKVFIIVDDGLTSDSKKLIEKHLQNVEFVARSSVTNSSCPSGGTWERLLTLADYNDKYFVIQLDSDTVTLNNPEAVQQAIQTGKSFTLSTTMGRNFISAETAAINAMTIQSSHVQVLAERALSKVPALRDKLYIRGCSGFAGFAKGELSRESIESFSQLMAAQLGAECWSSWGSEQMTSNFLVANTSQPTPLPFEQFPYWAPKTDLAEARLVHFIGDHRFTSGKYTDVALGSIRELEQTSR